ncbi:hypothetical protein LUZ60_001295 [Juncus effusus]|nr:hypothetical protein LUZ60_001295 [Juncus effusus]
MARRRYEDDESEREEMDEEQEEMDEEEEEEEERISRRKTGGKRGRGTSTGGGKKRARSEFIDDVAIEDDDEEEEEDDEDYGRGGRKKKPRASQFLDLEAAVDSDNEEEDEYEAEDGFIDPDFGEEAGNRRERRPFIPEEHEEEDVDEIERQVKEHFAYSRSSQTEYAEDATDVEQQARLPSVKDPKLWLVKCKIGNHERKEAVNLMKKYKDLHITSVIALDHLKNYIYVEAYKEAHVREACKGFRDFSAKIVLVPIEEMADVLSAERKAVDLARGSWVRMKNKIAVYNGDLAKVVNVDNVRQKVTVKLIPRVDLQMLANKQEGREVPKKEIIPPQRFFNIEEARDMRIRVERKKHKDSGQYFEMVDGLMFKDGFLYKTVAMSSVTADKIQPSFDELEKFQRPGNDGTRNITSLLNRIKGNFMRGDPVIVVRGELKNLEGWVEKVEEGIVHVKPKDESLGKALAFKEEELCKHFKLGDRVEVVSGTKKGKTGMVVKVDGHVLTILSHTTQEHIDVFASDVVQSSGIMTGVTQIGGYELHDLVLLNDMSFGVIVSVESKAFQVLKWVPDRSEVVSVKLGQIKGKIEGRIKAKDCFNKLISSKDFVTVVDGPLEGKKGTVEHIYNGILFIHERAGFICAKARSCRLAGGSNNSHRSSNKMNALESRYGAMGSSSNVFHSQPRLPPKGPFSHYGDGGRSGGGRGQRDELVGKTVRIRSGPYKGCLGRVTELVTDVIVRVELQSQINKVTVNRDQIIDATNTAAGPSRELRYSLGGETPIHPSRTPLRPMQTPMRDPSGTPIHGSGGWHPMSSPPTTPPMRV